MRQFRSSITRLRHWLFTLHVAISGDDAKLASGWDARLGASYEEVVSLGIGGYGGSNLFQKYGGELPPCVGAPTAASLLLGLEA